MRSLVTAVLTLAFFTSGCGTFRSLKDSDYVKSERKAGRDPVHIRSCGPDAVYDALHYIHREIYFVRDPFSRKEISIFIQKRHTTACRDFYSVFDERARGITFVSDLMAILRHYNIGMYKSDSLDIKDINKEEVAIVLIRKRDTLQYHWVVHPVYDNIYEWYGSKKSTSIEAIYILKRL